MWLAGGMENILAARMEGALSFLFFLVCCLYYPPPPSYCLVGTGRLGRGAVPLLQEPGVLLQRRRARARVDWHAGRYCFEQVPSAVRLH